STQLEGVSLTEIEAQLLLDDGLTAKGKPLEHHLMVKDNYDAIRFAMQAGSQKQALTPTFLKELNAANMASTGAVVSSAMGTVDGRTGNFRLVNAFSEALGYYSNPQKIQESVSAFCDFYDTKTQTGTQTEILQNIFDAHVNLVLIHPWMDGNKRTSRLLMNFLQQRADIPLTKVHKEDGEDYIACMKIAKDTGNLQPFSEFMAAQHIKTLKAEISLFEEAQQKNLKSSTLNKNFALFF
ncbi:MAG: Fic family protein, partial [Candidatus Symbiothrix sp.]|nr:Fic family protein [Candidatus Symbiothrix sp.]